MNKFIKTTVTSEFTQIPNVIITDGRLTAGALRLILALYSLPKDWIVTLSGLAGRFGMRRSTVATSMKLLRELGYVEVTEERDGDGRFSYRYVLCDLEKKAERMEKAAAWEIRKTPKASKKTQPVENFSQADITVTEKTDTDFTDTEKTDTVPPHTTNNVLTNTENTNTVLTNIDRCSLSEPDGDAFGESTEDFCKEAENERLHRRTSHTRYWTPSTTANAAVPLPRKVEAASLPNAARLRDEPLQSSASPQPAPPSGAGVWTPTRANTDYHAIKSLVKSNLDYDVARERFDFTDDVVNLMAEELSSPDEYVKIGSRRYPADTVKDRLRQIKCSHLEYIDLALSEKRGRIKNPKAYLLSMLFNAPATINTYFENRVRNDGMLG